MKKWLLTPLLIACLCCTQQVINRDTTFLDNHSFEEIWNASIEAVDDIDFTIASMDKSSGFISAESGPRIFEDNPPHLSITIEEINGKVMVECKVLQKEFIDIAGHGRRTIKNFLAALNMNLNRR
jgi:hypothetical protein